MEAGYFLDTQDFVHSSCSSGDEEMLRKAKGCAYGFLSLADATRCSRPGPKIVPITELHFPVEPLTCDKFQIGIAGERLVKSCDCFVMALEFAQYLAASGVCLG